MRKQFVGASLLSVVLVFGVIDRSSVVTAGGFDWSTVALGQTEVADNETEGGDKAKKKSDNGFTQALSAPFRALGRLFGGGKKKNEEVRRSTNEQDRKTFESTKLLRINDARTALETPAETAPAAGSLETHLQKGREFLMAGNLSGAIAELTLAASLDPNSAAAKNLLGVAYEGKGLRDRALESFKAAVQADKNNAEYLNNYGFLLLKNNDLNDATKYLKRAVKLSPNDARIWNNLGLVQSERLKFDDAFDSFLRAGGAFSGHMNIAAQLYKRGYAKEAIKHLEQAQTLQPNSFEVLAKLANLYQMTGRISDAEAARRSIVALRTFAEANK